MSQLATGLLKDFAAVDHADAQDLIERLDHQRRLRFWQRYKEETYELMGAGPGKHLGDVGCGPGEDVRTLAGMVGPDGTATGFDMSETMIEEAMDRHGDCDLPLTFRHCPGDRLEQADNTLDGIRADRVLIHVPDPAAVIADMIRVLKPGGRIVISEPDMEGVWQDSRHIETSRKLLRLVAGSVPNSFVARQLRRLFREAGLVDVEMHVRPAIITDYEEAYSIMRFDMLAEIALRDGVVTEDEGSDWFLEAREMKKAGLTLFGANFFLVAGSKPA
jgi:ubiquinone/menaquinone biosynthesis C-methylase UbiE